MRSLLEKPDKKFPTIRYFSFQAAFGRLLRLWEPIVGDANEAMIFQISQILLAVAGLR